MSWILRLLGFDPSKPVDFLIKVLGMVDSSKLQSEVQSVLCAKMTAARKKTVSGLLVQASQALDANDCLAFAKVVSVLVEGVKL